MTEATGWNEPEPGTDPATPADPPADVPAPPQPEPEPEPAPEPEPEPEPAPDPNAPDIPDGQPDWLAREFGKIHERLTALEG